MKRLFSILIVLFFFVIFSGCITNVVNCPEDTLKTSSCPTEKEKEEEEERFLLFLLVLSNPGNATPPGLVK
ncbi:MAG: hypothetical protein OEZ34_04860 [Spirochaetia bacterium]|nr:hypothetical protein [Spirochaetia bacterium]